MNTTPHDSGTGQTQAEPPPATHQQLPPPHQDLDRLRRSVSDRYIAGVAGGLGRHFNVDPTVIRVLLAVLTLFGGAGVLVYAVCWAFVPEEGSEKAAIRTGSDARKILLLAAAGIAVLLAVSDSFSGFNAGFPIAGVAVVIGVIMIARDRRAEKRAGAGAPPVPPMPHAPEHDYTEGRSYVGSSYTGWIQPGEEAAAPSYGADYRPPAYQPPVIAPPILPPHPKRTGILWFWPTLALIAIALGVVGIIDGSHDVHAGVYPATALAITGVMLLVGSFVGRPGGLILLGIASTTALSAATVLGSFNFDDSRQLEDNPTSAAAVPSSYRVHFGEIVVDLTDVADPENLAGREIRMRLNAGEIRVIVPKSLNVDIEADLGFAGGINIPGYDGGGFEVSREKRLVGVPASTASPLELDLDVRVGQITVERR
ncbi:PspC domain-containing protein [Marmoricola sp. OAE513]|uniref:PspC domain-containing protein n=1 Tax=Marmoricola sp. OAE513 TaxID=2817894 RepID=UPI001AE6B501